jgi:hypothetical protein
VKVAQNIAVTKKHFRISTVHLARALLAFSICAAQAQTVDPRTNSWFTQYSGKYGRIYTNAAAQSAGNSATTWSNGTQTQSLPAYCGVQEYYSSSNWVYIRSTGLGSHIMGPWSAGFPNLPVNTHTFFRIPRMTNAPPAKTQTGLGAIGYFVDGVAMFNSWDAFTWNGSADAANTTGYWNRDAYVNEGATFDPAYAHQPQDGTYHYHAAPIALRYLLGDHVDYNATTKTYSELTNPVTRHSPILGWVKDGYPVYGPYGYSNPTNPASGIRRMISGYQLRNGQNGSNNLTLTGRTTIPAWEMRLTGETNDAQAGPAVSTSYPLGRYMQDNVYLGDLGKTQGVDFDLDEYNGRICYTPEFPTGIYAYFVSISSNGTPTFPYNIGGGFYGNPTGGSVTSLSEAVVTNYICGPNSATTVGKPSVAGNGMVTLMWSSVEGGTYEVLSSSNLSAWAMKATNLASQGITTQVSTNKDGSSEFYRVARTALASCDLVTSSGTTSATGGGILSVSPNSAGRGTKNMTLAINLDPSAQPAPPPQNAPINSASIGTIAGTSLVHVSQTQVQATFSIPANATTGQETVTVVFPGPPGNPSQTVTYTLTSGFTIN